MIGDKYDLSGQIKEIKGYKFSLTKGNIKGNLKKEKQIIIFKYSKIE